MTSSFLGSPSACSPPLAGSLRGLVHGLAELHGGLHQVGGAGLDDLGVLAAERRLSASIAVSMPCLSAAETLSPYSFERLLGRVDQALALVLGLDELAALLVLGGVRLGVLHHLLDVGLERPPEAWMRICCSLPVALSFAVR